MSVESKVLTSRTAQLLLGNDPLEYHGKNHDDLFVAIKQMDSPVSAFANMIRLVRRRDLLKMIGELNHISHGKFAALFITAGLNDSSAHVMEAKGFHISPILEKVARTTTFDDEKKDIRRALLLTSILRVSAHACAVEKEGGGKPKFGSTMRTLMQEASKELHALRKSMIDVPENVIVKMAASRIIARIHSVGIEQIIRGEEGLSSKEAIGVVLNLSWFREKHDEVSRPIPNNLDWNAAARYEIMRTVYGCTYEHLKEEILCALRPEEVAPFLELNVISQEGVREDKGSVQRHIRGIMCNACINPALPQRFNRHALNGIGYEDLLEAMKHTPTRYILASLQKFAEDSVKSMKISFLHEWAIGFRKFHKAAEDAGHRPPSLEKLFSEWASNMSGDFVGGMTATTLLQLSGEAMDVARATVEIAETNPEYCRDFLHYALRGASGVISEDSELLGRFEKIGRRFVLEGGPASFYNMVRIAVELDIVKYVDWGKVGQAFLTSGKQWLEYGRKVYLTDETAKHICLSFSQGLVTTLPIAPSGLHEISMTNEIYTQCICVMAYRIHAKLCVKTENPIGVVAKEAQFQEIHHYCLRNPQYPHDLTNAVAVLTVPFNRRAEYQKLHVGNLLVEKRITQKDLQKVYRDITEGLGIKKKRAASREL